MTAPDIPVREIQRLLATHAGMPVTVRTLEPIYGATVFRCTLAAPLQNLGDSVIVKRRRAEGEARSGPEMMRTEAAGLRFLTTNGIRSGPRLIGADTTAGFVVMEDLGDGPSLEDLLFGGDRRAAVEGLVAFGTALGQLHAATAGRAEAFLAAQCRQGSTQSAWEPAGAFGISFSSSWKKVQSSVETYPELPQALDLEHDIHAMLKALAPAGPYLVMTNGDPCPGNTRFTSGAIRFLDFEQATFHHALLDLPALHLPFPACPCWSVLPDEAAAPAIHAWRTAFARYHPGALDDDEYLPGVAAACLAWAILRLGPLSRLDGADERQPVGFSKRAQRLATIDAAVRVARRADTLTALTDWLAALSRALRERWSDGPLTLTVCPAFAADRPDLPQGKLPPVPDDKGGIRVRNGAKA